MVQSNTLSFYDSLVSYLLLRSLTPFGINEYDSGLLYPDGRKIRSNFELKITPSSG
jgi:hypothetical protein